MKSKKIVNNLIQIGIFILLLSLISKFQTRNMLDTDKKAPENQFSLISAQTQKAQILNFANNDSRTLGPVDLSSTNFVLTERFQIEARGL